MPILFKQLIHKLNIFLNFILYDVSELQRSLIICSSFEHIIFTELDTAHPLLINLDVKKVQYPTKLPDSAAQNILKVNHVNVSQSNPILNNSPEDEKEIMIFNGCLNNITSRC